MVVKEYNIFPYNLLFIFILFLQISYIHSTLSFEYPTSVTLKNGNIFIIHKTGVTICDPSMTMRIKDILNFSTNQISNINYLSKVTISQFEDGYIISVIIDKIFIFDIEGELKYTDNQLITNSELDIYYSLSIDEFYDNAYYYLVGFINNSKLNLKYCYYNPTRNEHKEAASDSLYDYAYDSYYNSYSIQNKGLSCQILNYRDEDLIVCSYYVKKNSNEYMLAFSYLNLYGQSFAFKGSMISYYPWEEIKCIKSIRGAERSKALFCLYLSTGELNCFLYDTNDHSTIYYYNDYNFCETQYSSLKVNYFPETEQYGLSCITKEGKMQVYIYNKNLEKSLYEIYLFNDCISLYGYSLIYSNNFTNYYIISDANCNGQIYSFKNLLDYIIKEEEVKEKEEKEEEDEKDKEEEDVKEKEKEEVKKEEKEIEDEEKEEEKKYMEKKEVEAKEKEEEEENDDKEEWKKEVEKKVQDGIEEKKEKENEKEEKVEEEEAEEKKEVEEKKKKEQEEEKEMKLRKKKLIMKRKNQ